MVSDKEDTVQILSQHVKSVGTSGDPETSANMLGGDWIEGRIPSGSEYFVDVPGHRSGEQFRLVSSTLQSTELRKLREEIYKLRKSGRNPET